MAVSDHLLMTGEQRKAFPAAAAWHPRSVGTHTCTHTNKHGHTYLNNGKHTFMQSLESTQTPLQIDLHADNFLLFVFFFCFSFFFFLWHHTFHFSLLCCAVRHGSVLHFSTLSSPSTSSLPASSSLSFTSCCGVTDSVTQEQTEGEAEGERRRDCESMRAACKTVEFANVSTINALQLFRKKKKRSYRNKMKYVKNLSNTN